MLGIVSEYRRREPLRGANRYLVSDIPSRTSETFGSHMFWPDASEPRFRKQC